tara:strand:- start:1646 stop:3517 length:1872 start_codon:yes stop_codon:yes gene_type:complete
MADTNTYSTQMHPGADYGLDPKLNYSDSFIGDINGRRLPAGDFGFTTDARTANQVKAVSDKLKTGAKTIEVSGISMQQIDSIPKQHFDEINRLRKLVGADLTFHGPIVEPTGIVKQGWQENDRLESERQMFSAIQRAQKMDPKGNIVVTFHSSALPDQYEPVKKVKQINPETGKEEIKVVEFSVINQDGNFQSVTPKYDYLKDKQQTMQEAIKKTNEDAWFRQLQHTNFSANSGRSSLNSAIKLPVEILESPEVKSLGGIKKLYKMYNENPQEAKKLMDAQDPEVGSLLMKGVEGFAHGDIYVRDAYQELQTLFNQAFKQAEDDKRHEDLERLKAYRNDLKPLLPEIENPEKAYELANKVVQGVNLLRSMDPPEVLKPFRDFNVDKSSETFANIAYKGFKEFKDNAPIISVENPPAGMAMSRADDIKDIVEHARTKFEKMAMKDGLSAKEAERQAEKHLGVTWDVGHINMIKKHGYTDKDLVKETEKVAHLVNKVHLSDNFGMDHTELPMGMGNVPTKPMLEAIDNYNKQVKRIVETGQWWEPFKITPFKQTTEAFGSSIYSSGGGGYWNQSNAIPGAGGYFAGQGFNPDVHHRMYGSGFSNLPTELGGQMDGGSRVSGNPME